MQYPIINNINDILPIIKDRKEFFVREKDGYVVIGYDFQTSDTFTGDPLLRECRGIMFDMNGKVIRRPFHKFFNINEQDSTKVENIVWTNVKAIQRKLDGSMVTPFALGNVGMRWASKAGITDTSMAAELFIANTDTVVSNYNGLAKDLMAKNITPIFEWCDATKPIVEKQPCCSLTLLAARNMTTGVYLTQLELIDLQYTYGVPLVERIEIPKDCNVLLKLVNSLTDREGYVIIGDDLYKAKSEWYVTLHRTKDDLNSESKIIARLLDGTLDDLKASLPESDKEILRSVETEFYQNYKKCHDLLLKKYNDYYVLVNGDKKTFALLEPRPSLDAQTKSILFALWDKTKTVDDVLKNTIKKNLGSETTYQTFKKEFLCLNQN